MRRSVSYQPANAYIISVQLDAESRQKLRELCQESGFSMSLMVKTLIKGARINRTHTFEQTPQKTKA